MKNCYKHFRKYSAYLQDAISAVYSDKQVQVLPREECLSGGVHPCFKGPEPAEVQVL